MKDVLVLSSDARGKRAGFPTSGILCGLVALILLCFSPRTLSFAETGKENKSTQDAFQAIEQQILKDGNQAQQEAKVQQVAIEIKMLDANQMALAREAERLAADPDNDADAAALVKSKLSLAEYEKSLAERRESFLKQKIEMQSRAHKKIQIYLRDIFSDGATVPDIIAQLKELRKAEQLRLREKRQLQQEITKVSSRIQIEEKYLSAKNVILAFVKTNTMQQSQEAIAVASERLKLQQEMKSLLEEQLQFTESRMLTIDEFDRMIRLRRLELLRIKLGSKESLPYDLPELILALTAAFFVVIFLLFRRRLTVVLRIAGLVPNRVFFVFFGKVIGFLLTVFLMGYLALNAVGYRFAGIMTGFVGLNLVAGIVIIVFSKWIVELLFLNLFAKQIARTTQVDGKQSSIILFLINTLFTWLLAWQVFSEILKFWAAKKEVVEFMDKIVNCPWFQSGKVTISVWTLARSGIAFWIFYFLGQLFISFLRSYVLPKTSLDRNSQHAVKSVVKMISIVTGVLVGVQLLGVDMGALAVFSGTLGIGIGFGLQDIVKNVFSGVMILFERPIKIGDIVEVNSTLGSVKSIRTRSTVVNTFDNVSIVVPNSEFLSQRVVNWSHSDPIVRLDINVGVDYSSDVMAVRDTLLEIAQGNPLVISMPEPFVIFSEFGDSALLFKLYLWTDVNDRMTVKSEINFAIYAKFKEKGIQIPFPQSDLHLKSMDFEFKPKT